MWKKNRPIINTYKIQEVITKKTKIIFPTFCLYEDVEKLKKMSKKIKFF